jgi:hypothetical protein
VPNLFLQPSDPDVNSSAATATAAWSMSGSVASQSFAGCRATLDVTTPGRGLEVQSADGDAVLGVDLTALADHWVRGADVVATYEPADPRRLRSTVMWRALGCQAGVASWEVVVSAQTALLETDVAVAVHADVAAAILLWSAGGAAPHWQPLAPATALPETATAILLRRPASTCLVAVHPSDARRIDAARHGDRWELTCRLFAAPLEKGVLLRSRVLAAVGPAGGDTAWAERILGAFAASPPPLTT